MSLGKIDSINSNNYPEPPNCNMKKELIPESFNGPTQKRTRTNGEFMVFFIIFLVIWVLLAIYCIAHGDLNRLRLDVSSKEIEKKTMPFLENIMNSGWEIYSSSLFSVVISLLIIILFRHYAGTIVWVVNGFVISVLTIISATLWFEYAAVKDYLPDNAPNPSEETGVFVGAISSTIITALYTLIVYGMRKQIKLMCALFVEAGKVTQMIPFILTTPLWTLLIAVAAMSLSGYFALWIESSGFEMKTKLDEFTYDIDSSFEKKNNYEVVYVQNEIMQFARGYNIIAAVWIAQFLIGCQDFIIAFATATWYFTRDKSTIRGSLFTSCSYLIKYHLGSVILGSLVILAVKFIRILVQILSRRDYRNPLLCMISCFFQKLFELIERFVAFLTRNAYIEMAIFGQGFWDSGKRAFEVVTSNVSRVITINSVGDFTLMLAKLVVVGLTVAVGKLMLNDKPSVTDLTGPLIVIGVFAFIISNAFMSSFGMIVDALFICFIEDCDINNGKENPYYMNQELLVYMSDQEKQRRILVGDAVEN